MKQDGIAFVIAAIAHQSGLATSELGQLALVAACIETSLKIQNQDLLTA